MSRKDQLILFTNGFPCVKEGEEFLERELEILSAEFKSIIIYVLNKAEICRNIPSNTRVKFLQADPSFKVRNVILKNGLTLWNIQKEDKKDPVAKEAMEKNKAFYRNVLIGNFLLKQTLEKELASIDLSRTKLYSYWCGPWFDILMLLDKSITDKITFRAHGYDFDVNQRPEKYIPYRNYLIKKNPFISFVSKFGFLEYALKYPGYKNKTTHRLGVTEQTVFAENRNSDILIVSCSSFIRLKRVHLIVEILKELDIKVKWVHFGDGPLFKEIKEKAEKELPNNIAYEFKGYVSHKEILKFYRENYVDLFINVSELEGIPVSVMEAISFGIPVAGCKTCGVPEIVTHETGFLWDINFDVTKAARQLDEYLLGTDSEKKKLRVSARNFWDQNFNADKNYKAFIKDCLLN